MIRRFFLVGALVLTTVAFAAPSPKKPAPKPVPTAAAAATTKAPPPPPAVPNAVDPGQARSPYEALLEPSLAGSSAQLDLTTLKRTITKFTLTSDVSPLTKITAAEKPAVIHQFAVDPRWRLVQWDGAIVAFRRAKDAVGEWTAPTRGYHASEAGVWRGAVRFTPWKADVPWVKSELIGRAPASSGSIEAKAFSFSPHPGWKATALSWSGPEVSLEVFEASASDDLENTSLMLSIVPGYVTSILTDIDVVRTRGYTVGMLPAQEPQRGEPKMAISSPSAGELEIRARLHLAGPGITWIRVLDANLKPWEELAVGAGTREILGWSERSDELFYMQGRFPVPAGLPFSGTAEVWFQKTTDGVTFRPDATPPVRLGAFPVTIPKR